jgi:tetratricopeptide repeat protein 30
VVKHLASASVLRAGAFKYSISVLPFGFLNTSMMQIVFQILNVSAIVLANLCVSYIMTSQNEEAEEMMRKIEKEEEQLAYDDPDKKVFHLCIVNLVIG